MISHCIEKSERGERLTPLELEFLMRHVLSVLRNVSVMTKHAHANAGLTTKETAICKAIIH